MVVGMREQLRIPVSVDSGGALRPRCCSCSSQNGYRVAVKPWNLRHGPIRQDGNMTCLGSHLNSPPAGRERQAGGIQNSWFQKLAVSKR